MTDFLDSRRLGVCYYPEHWPEALWVRDAEEMREIGISVVRIGEFSWSRLEPSQGDYQFEWLWTVFDTLHNAGLKIVTWMQVSAEVTIGTACSAFIDF